MDPRSSVLGLVALRYRGAYVASKFAIEALTDAIRLELRGSGVHISLIEPGPIVSRFRANAYEASSARTGRARSREGLERGVVRSRGRRCLGGSGADRRSQRVSPVASVSTISVRSRRRARGSSISRKCCLRASGIGSSSLRR